MRKPRVDKQIAIALPWTVSDLEAYMEAEGIKVTAASVLAAMTCLESGGSEGARHMWEELWIQIRPFLQDRGLDADEIAPLRRMRVEEEGR